MNKMYLFEGVVTTYKIIIIAAVIFNFAHADANAIMQLDDLKWKNRSLLLFSPSITDSDYTESTLNLDSLAIELIDRDLIVFHIFQNETGFYAARTLSEKSVMKIRSYYQPDSTRLTAVLIGKDGGEKYRKIGVVNWQDIFRRIDAMPMRQAEIKKQRLLRIKK